MDNEIDLFSKGAKIEMNSDKIGSKFQNSASYIMKLPVTICGSLTPTLKRSYRNSQNSLSPTKLIYLSREIYNEHSRPYIDLQK